MRQVGLAGGDKNKLFLKVHVTPHRYTRLFFAHRARNDNNLA